MIRHLARLAGTVPELRDAELRDLVTTRAVRFRRRRNAARSLPAVAAAAVLALGISVQLDRAAPRPSSTVPGGNEIVTFPEATALQLLLARDPQGDA